MELTSKDLNLNILISDEGERKILSEFIKFIVDRFHPVDQRDGNLLIEEKIYEGPRGMIFYGKGNNGKTTLINKLRDIVSILSLSSLVDEPGCLSHNTFLFNDPPEVPKLLPQMIVSGIPFILETSDLELIEEIKKIFQKSPKYLTGIKIVNFTAIFNQ